MTMGKTLLPRRQFITGLASSAGLVLGGCTATEPPTYGNVLRMGDFLNYKAHRLLLATSSLAREYDRREISSAPAIGTTDPANSGQPFFVPQHGEAYDHMRKNAFVDYQLTVEGSVSRPSTFSLAELMRMPARTQITRHTCEEGWSSIAEWTGVPLRLVLEAAGIEPEARCVQLFAYDRFEDSIDMLDALHPQTILAYGMNGRELPIGHGAPLRLRVETQLGYKSLKFLRSIVVRNQFRDDWTIPAGWSWYAGI
jgi:DMSO/TMAO reductase YedYZ molybdopterin-dependent catalytic subunit